MAEAVSDFHCAMPQSQRAEIADRQGAGQAPAAFRPSVFGPQNPHGMTWNHPQIGRSSPKGCSQCAAIAKGDIL